MLVALRTYGRIYLRTTPVAHFGAFSYCLAAVLEFFNRKQGHLKGLLVQENRRNKKTVK